VFGCECHVEHVPLAGLAVLDEAQRVEIGDGSQAACDGARRGRPTLWLSGVGDRARPLLNSSMTACSGVGEPIARTLPDSLSPNDCGAR
jgi:hypothetical protein